LAQLEGFELSGRDALTAHRWYGGPFRSRQGRPIRKLRGARCIEVTDDAQLWKHSFEVWSAARSKVTTLLEHVKGPGAYQTQFLFTEEDQDTQRGQSWQARVRDAITFYSSEFSLTEFVARMTSGAKGLRLGLDGFIPVPL